MENLNLLLKRLLESKLDFVLIGGYAAVIHGSSQVTHDVDIGPLGMQISSWHLTSNPKSPLDFSPPKLEPKTTFLHRASI